MKHRFEFAPLASLQIESTRDRIAERSPEAAVRWEAGLFEALESIRDLPGRCPVAPESVLFGEEIRELLYGKRPGTRRILYAIRGDVIRVVAVRHAARGAGWP
jgi:plasmid stabilization system protein ParE